MPPFIFILLTAAINLSIGYALAVFLGYGRLPWDAPTIIRAPEAEDSTIATDDPTPADEPVESTRTKSGMELSVEELRQDNGEHRSALVAIEQRVRECSENPTPEALEACHVDFQAANEQFMEKQAAAVTELKNAEPGLHDVVRDTVIKQVQSQAAEVMQINGEAAHAEMTDDNLAEYCQKLLAQTDGLLEKSHDLRDSLHEALSEIGTAEGEPALQTAQAGFEAALEEFWAQDPTRLQALSASSIHVDNLRELNQEHGTATIDVALDHIANVVTSLKSEQCTVTRLRGSRFLLLFGGQGPQDSSREIEKLRQTIDHVKFCRGDVEISTTISCAVVESLPDDTTASMIERLESTIQEAIRYGRNRTFLFEGEYPTPVVPPELSIETQQIDI